MALWSREPSGGSGESPSESFASSPLRGAVGRLRHLSWNHWKTDDPEIGNVQAGEEKP